MQLEDCLVLAWCSLFVILCYKKPWEQLWSVVRVANMTSSQDIIRTSWVNCNWNTLSVDFKILLHQIHVFYATVHYNGLNCLMRLWLNNIRMCRMCHNLDSKPPPDTCGGVFCHIWLWLSIYLPLWQLTSPYSEVLLFSDISAGR